MDEQFEDGEYGDHGGPYDEGDYDPGAYGEDGGATGLAGRWASLSPNAKKGVIGGVVAALLLIGGSILALGGKGGDSTAATTIPGPTTTTIAITTTTEPDTGPVAPLTGLRLADPGAASRPALAVKIDNLDIAKESAVPQAGLPKADVVFEEIVEGNITRLVAIFQSQNPGNRVGPVRSARTTDIHILPQLGRTLLAWSGGNGGVTAAVEAAPSIIDLGHNRATTSYTRDRSRKAPHNLYVDAGSLWGRAPDEVTPPQPLFEFRRDGDPNPPSAETASGVTLTWGGGFASAPVGWTWDPELKLYKRDQQGRPHADEGGTQIGAQNVVVLITPYGQSPADLRSPEALTIGSGEALVFSNGVLVRGTWDRPDPAKPARLTDASGAVIRLTPGQTWIELPRAGEVTVR